MKNSFFLLMTMSACIFACSNTIETNDIVPVEIKDSTSTVAKNDKSLLALQPFATGDTISKPVKPDINLSWENSADLKPLSSKTKEEFNYIAIGGGITAGWRDGGLYRQGQQTSYPNLIAHQMGLVNFKNPLFSAEKGNGTGYKVYNSNKVNWDFVGNNTAIEQKMPLKLEKYLSEVNNWGMPKMPILKGDYTPLLLQTPNSDAYYANKRFTVYLERYLSKEKEEKISYKELIYNKENKPDFFSLELGTEDIVYSYINGYESGFPDPTVVDVLRNYNELLESGAKGIICTIPDLLQTPYFNIYVFDEQKSKIKLQDVVYSENGQSFQRPGSRIKFLPTEKVRQMIESGTYGTWGSPLPLHDAVIDGNDYFRVVYNRKVKELGNDNSNLIVFDLEDLYKKVIAGQYISEDGFKIDASFPNGNFFSQDGIYPSAIGQAVIANELIKVINKKYQTQIPLINLTTYSKKLL